jgi:hypothetical protein
VNTVDTATSLPLLGALRHCTHAPPASPAAHRSICLPAGGRVWSSRPCDDDGRVCRWNPTTVIMGADGVMRTPEELDDEVPGEM